MVDAGGASDRWDAGRDRIVPYLETRGVDELDLFLISHADLDHVGGAQAIIRAFPTRLIVDPGLPVPSATYSALLETAKEYDVPWMAGRTGQRFEIDGVELTVLAPDSLRLGRDINDQSLILMLRYGAFEALFTGDASSDIEEELRLPGGVSVEVLKVGHHGSRTSSGQHFLNRLKPELAVIQVGERNRYGHPDPGVLRRLRASGAHILRTDRHGVVRISADDSGRWKVDLERGVAPMPVPLAR